MVATVSVGSRTARNASGCHIEHNPNLSESQDSSHQRARQVTGFVLPKDLFVPLSTKLSLRLSTCKNDHGVHNICVRSAVLRWQ